MSTYFSYYGSSKDPYCKHEIEGGGIATLKRNNFLLLFYGSWDRTDFFSFSEKTSIVDERIDENGTGWLTLQSDDRKETFYVYQNANEFIGSVKSRLGLF